MEVNDSEVAEALLQGEEGVRGRGQSRVGVVGRKPCGLVNFPLPSTDDCEPYVAKGCFQGHLR